MPDALLPILTGAGVHVLAVMSPGPNFLVISRTAMAHSRRDGFAVTGGVATGTVAYVTMGFLGISAVVARSIALFTVLKFVGAVYLGYLGVRTLLAARRAPVRIVDGEVAAVPLGTLAAYRLGLFTMATNPKAALYFLAFFTTIVPADASWAVKAGLLCVLPAISFGWYAVVVTAFSQPRVRLIYRRAQRVINLAFGGLLVILAVAVARSSR